METGQKKYWPNNGAGTQWGDSFESVDGMVEFGFHKIDRTMALDGNLLL